MEHSGGKATKWRQLCSSAQPWECWENQSSSDCELQTQCDQATGHPCTQPALLLPRERDPGHTGCRAPGGNCCAPPKTLCLVLSFCRAVPGAVSHLAASAFSEGWGTEKIPFWCQFKSRIQTMGNLSCSVRLMLHKQCLRKPEWSLSLHGCQRLIDQHETCWTWWNQGGYNHSREPITN